MELYHVLNRGVEKRVIVVDDSDRLRFVHSLFVFNDARHVDENHRRPGWTLETRARAPLVDIHAWCLMPNHYHLLLSEASERGIPLFMQKFNMGYAKYFNERYARSGVLWQGKHKKIRIQRDAHFLHIPLYIHLNPLDLSMPEWRMGRVLKFESAREALATYRWSSHLDYWGEKNFSSVIETSLLRDVLGSRKRYESSLSNVIIDPEVAARSESLEK